MFLGRDSLPVSSPNSLECYEGIHKNLVKRTRQLEAVNEELIKEIAERRRIEECLRQVEQKYRSIFENTVEGIFQITPDGYYQTCNQSLARIYGYESPGELLKNLTNIRQQRYVDPNRYQELMEQLRSQDKVTDFESQVYRPDGSIIWISEKARAVRDRYGNLLYYEGFVIDITERKLAEESWRRSQAELQAKTAELQRTVSKLEQTQKQLIEKDKLSTLGELLAGIAHEINNPVNFLCNNLPHASQYAQDLLNLLQLYKKYYPQPMPEIEQEAEAIDLNFLIEDFAKTLSSMELGANRLRQLVHSLKIVSGSDEDRLQAVNIHEGIDSTLLMLYHRLKPKGDNPGIVIFKNYGKLPLVHCYPCGLNQVFMNLLCNAIDALEQVHNPSDYQLAIPGTQEPWDGEIIAPTTIQNGQKQPKIQIKFASPSIWIWTEFIPKNLDTNDSSEAVAIIRIIDNGAGMDDEVIERIFDPFFTTKVPGKGTGLGLSISYQIIKKHSGQLICNSTPGQGTEFVIKIPVEHKFGY